MTYTEAKARKQELEDAASQAGAAVRSYPRNAVGLVSDAVRVSPAYQADKAASARAFRALQVFNAAFVKTFATERMEERRTSTNA